MQTVKPGDRVKVLWKEFGGWVDTGVVEYYNKTGWITINCDDGTTRGGVPGEIELLDDGQKSLVDKCR